MTTAAGNRLTQARQRAGLNKSQLAERVDVTYQTILNLEKGTYKPRMDLANKLAAQLGVTIEELFG